MDYFFDINTKVSHAISDRSRIYASFYMGQDALLFGHENKEADTRDVFLWRWGNLVGSAGWNQVISPTLFLNMTAGYSRFRSRIKQDYQDYERLLGGDKQLYAETQDYRSAIEDWSTRATFDWTPSPRHRARFGVDYLYHQFRPENSERMEQVATNEASWSEVSTLVRGHELSLHAEDEIHVDDYLWVNLGGRYTLFRVDGRDYHSLQPRLSARFRVRPDFSIKLAYDKWAAHRDAAAGLSDEEKAAKDAAFQEQGLVVASGLLGGESIVGVILAFVSVGLSLLG